MNQRRYPRMARVNEVVREVLADELETMDDPGLGLVTITGVEVSPDLKSAKVFYSALPPDGSLEVAATTSDESGADVPEGTEESPPDATNALRAARRELQAALGRQVRLKYVPRLAFVPDPAVQAGRRIDDIIRELHEEEGP